MFGCPSLQPSSGSSERTTQWPPFFAVSLCLVEFRAQSRCSVDGWMDGWVEEFLKKRKTCPTGSLSGALPSVRASGNLSGGSPARPLLVPQALRGLLGAAAPLLTLPWSSLPLPLPRAPIGGHQRRREHHSPFPAACDPPLCRDWGAYPEPPLVEGWSGPGSLRGEPAGTCGVPRAGGATLHRWRGHFLEALETPAGPWQPGGRTSPLSLEMRSGPGGWV